MKGAARRSPTTRSAASPPTRQSSARSSVSRGPRAGPVEDRIAERVRLSRQADPAIPDRDGSIRMRIKRLAAERGVEPGPLIEEWRARAWAMTCADVPDAERRACEHVEERLGA